MQVTIVVYDRRRGWTPTPPEDLDSERTLVVAFGASSFLSDSAPFKALRRTLP
jgi:hypothetical protein